MEIFRFERHHQPSPGSAYFYRARVQTAIREADRRQIVSKGIGEIAEENLDFDGTNYGNYEYQRSSHSHLRKKISLKKASNNAVKTKTVKKDLKIVVAKRHITPNITCIFSSKICECEHNTI